MARAKAEITITHLVDISSVTRYYLLQSSTVAAPSKPTIHPPPSTWTLTEPSYTSGSTSTLYFVDCTVFTNATFRYSAVSKSSAYEAAKAAYNKAAAVETRMTFAETQISQNKSAIELKASKTDITAVSEGNLIVNGFGLNKDNYNFSQWTFNGTDKCDGFPSFTYTGVPASPTIPQYIIPIDLSRSYEFSMFFKGDSSKKLYIGWDEFDIDGKQISATHCMGFADSTTTLARELKNGDTVVYLTSANGWTSTSYTHQLGLIFWNYKDSTGYQYPVGVYSRNAWLNLYTFDNVNKTTNAITLKSAWAYGAFPAGTTVSQSNSAGHKYFKYQNSSYPSDWTEVTHVIAGDQPLYTFQSSKINQAAKYARFIILHNYGGGTTTSTTSISRVRFRDVTTDKSVDLAQATADAAQESVTEAESLIRQLADNISMLVTDGNGTSLMTQTEDGWVFSTSELQSLVDATSEGLDSLVNDLGSTAHTVDVLQQAVDDLGVLTDYIAIGTYEDQPCIELGETDSEFKLRITNTKVVFMEGSSILAYFNNQSMHIKKAVIEEELQQGGFAWKVRSNGNMGLVWKGATS
mgnify:CR=1 FL=1